MKDDQAAYIIHYYFKRLNQYALKLKKDPVTTGFDEKTIHLFRVDVKKLRAFLRMIRHGTEDHEHLKFSRKFKKMYSLAGKVRDRQLCIKRIKEHEPGKNIRLRNKIEALEKELTQLNGKKDDLPDKKELAESETKMVEQARDVNIKPLVKKFFLFKLENIRKIAAKESYKDKELHSIRKNIKDIVYIFRIFIDCKTPLPFSFWNRTGLKKAEGLAHTLGLFNDAGIALSFIKPAEIKKDNTEEKEHLSALRRKWLAEKRSLKKKALNEFKGIKWNL